MDEVDSEQGADSRAAQLLLAQKRIRQDWVAELEALGDERSIALSQRLGGPGEDGDPAARERLLDLARHTADPVVYAWALETCAGEADCQGLSPRRWASLDPGNLRPWLIEAARAQVRGDLQGVRDALYQVSQSNRSDDYAELMQQRLVGLSHSDSPGLRQTAELFFEIGQMAAQPIPSYSPATKYCAADAMGDPNRQQLCASVADALWQQGRGLIDKSVALAVARKLPNRAAVWVERAESTEARLQASQSQTASNWQPAHDGVWRCQDVAAFRQRWRQRVQQGEWDASGQWLAGQGPQAQRELARQWRESAGRSLLDERR